VLSASGLNALIGAWLIVAGFVIYGRGDADWNAWWVGAVVLVLGLLRVSGAYRESWMSYVNALLGAWLFVAAFWLESSPAAFWNDFACGIAIFILGVLSATASDEAAAAGTGAWYRR
jgi:hypothetical protein